MKKYVFKDCGYLKYNYNYGEQDYLIEIWRCIKGDILYNSSNQEQCYIAALYKEGILDVKDNNCLVDEDIYGWNLDQLKQLCEDNGIEVVFVNEEDLKYE